MHTRGRKISRGGGDDPQSDGNSVGNWLAAILSQQKLPETSHSSATYSMLQPEQAAVTATTAAEKLEVWIKAITTLVGATTGLTAYLYSKGIWPFRERLPRIVRKELKRLARSNAFIRETTRMRVTFLRVEGETLFVKMEFEQKTRNITRKEATLNSLFSSNNRPYRLGKVSVDGREVKPLNTTASDFRIHCSVPPRQEVLLLAVWEVEYRTTDSELMVAYGLGETLELEVRDDVSVQARKPVFAFDIEPLVEPAKMEGNGVTPIAGHDYSHRIVVKNGHLPNTGANIRWKRISPSN